MMKPRFRSAVLVPLALTASLGLSACARQISPNVVAGPAVGEVIRTEIGWIESARVVEVQESDRLEGNTAGILIGGAAGGLAGNQIGHGVGRIFATGIGALAGAAIGSLAEKELKRQTAIEYVFRNEIGQIYTIVQGPQPRLVPGQQVYLQDSGRGRARLVPAG